MECIIKLKIQKYNNIKKMNTKKLINYIYSIQKKYESLRLSHGYLYIYIIIHQQIYFPIELLIFIYISTFLYPKAFFYLHIDFLLLNCHIVI